MNIYLFCIVAETTLIGWIWFFIERRSEKSLMDTVTKGEIIHAWGGSYTGESLYELAATDENINDFFLGRGIFKSEHKQKTYHLISSKQLRKLEQWYSEARQHIDPDLRIMLTTFMNDTQDEYYELINHIKNS